MRSFAAIVLVLGAVAVRGQTAVSSPASLPGGPVLSGGPVLDGPPVQRRLGVRGQQFVTADGRPFDWRGITAFPLLEFVARGREADADRFLAWARARHLTVARVLAMGRNVVSLSPEAGRAALPRLLEMARRHQILIEVVALADTRDVPVDRDEHVGAIGRLIREHGSGVLEIANEPVHPTQAPEVQKPDVLARLRARVPAIVPVALGSIERGEGFAAGDYVTWHVPREASHGGWGHVLAIAEGEAILRARRKPVISDEPIGSGDRLEPGRRDDSPPRFRAAALLTRLVGLGATFHYQGGLQGTVPVGRQLECFNAWSSAWTLLPPDIERRGTFRRAGEPGAAVASYSTDRALGVFERQTADTAWVLVIDPRPSFSAAWADGWRVSRVRRLDGAWIITARKRQGARGTGGAS